MPSVTRRSQIEGPRPEQAAAALRWLFLVATLAPPAALLGWIAAGEATPTAIGHPDLQNLYDGDVYGSHFFLEAWSLRIALFATLVLLLARYVLRVRGLVTSVGAGVLLTGVSCGYVWTVMRYSEAEARLALVPYLFTVEDASFWIGPFILVVMLICGLAPVLDDALDRRLGPEEA